MEIKEGLTCEDGSITFPTLVGVFVWATEVVTSDWIVEGMSTGMESGDLEPIFAEVPTVA